MNSEIKTKWIEALRSGEYRQTTHALRDTTGYCCLGVLQEIVAGKSCWRDHHHPGGAYFTRLGNAHIPDNDVLGKSELVDDYTYLTHLNDTDKMTFSEIAYYIETNL